MPHKKCPICNKHSIIHKNIVITDDNEFFSDWYCRTCKRIINTEELYPTLCGYKRFCKKGTSITVVAKPMDSWEFRIWEVHSMQIGDYRVTGDDGKRFFLEKEIFESTYIECKEEKKE